VGRKRQKKAARRGRAPATPSLKDAMRAVQHRKQSGKTSDGEWHLLSSIEGSLRKLGA